MNVAIIGAGPAGITAGYELSKNNISVDIFESSSSVGGMSKTIELWNQKVDIGSHRFFSTDKRVNDLWLEVIKDDYEMVNRLSRIYYNNNFFHYPIKAFDALSKLGILESFLCIFYYFIELFKLKKEHTTFEEWVTNKFGKRLYEIFFKTYTEKLWGIPCNLLDSDFASQRIKKFTLGEAIKTAILGNKNSHKTLVDQFAYPHDGTGILYERMKDYIESKGNNVYLNTPVNRVITKNNVAFSIELDNNQVKEYDYIISSMPLNILVSRFTNTPDNIKELSSKLKFRSTILVYLNVQGQNLFPDNWIYVHNENLKTGRITNFSNWVPHINNNQKSTICALEYWCYEGDDFWNKDNEEIINLAKKELRQTRLIKEYEISDSFVYRIPKCYPVYSKGYKEILEPIKSFLSEINNLQVIGRYGSFKYNNQDHSILMGKLASENILKSTKHKLWDINTDYDEYQEKSLISKITLNK